MNQSSAPEKRGSDDMLLAMAAGPITGTRSARTASVTTGDARALRLAVFVALNVVAIAIYLVVAGQMGLFNHLRETLFWSPDSYTYRDVAHWLLQTGPNTPESGHRPFLYPLLLGLAEDLGGNVAIWAFNFVCWIGMVNITSIATLRLTRSLAISAIVFLTLAANASLIVLSTQALTESLTAFLLSLWILGLTVTELPPTRPVHLALILLPISLLTVVRPQFEVELLIALALLAVTVWRKSKNRALLAAAAVTCCVPVLFQIALMASANHFVGISITGESEFKSYYVSQVYATVNGLPDDLVAARTVVDPWSNSQAIKFLLDHPRPAAGTLVNNLHRNLTSGSNFVTSAQPSSLASAIRETNRLYLKLHATFLPVVLLALWRRRDVRLLLVYVFAVLLTLAPSLIVDQGDRYIEVVLPLWAAAYGLAVADLLPDVSRIFQRWRRTTFA